ncbi:MAG: hypothetical protein Tp182DCM212571_79 [Prokaryotic dsDNA virus sp.]|nr:MAG: hypothetical protein Tp182DCM212571_79 [Prokaryotic dsDNA virus sp.]
MNERELAIEIVRDYLAEGPEYLAIVEATDEELEDGDPDRVAVLVRDVLFELAGNL